MNEETRHYWLKHGSDEAFAALKKMHSTAPEVPFEFWENVVQAGFGKSLCNMLTEAPDLADSFIALHRLINEDNGENNE